MQTLRECFEWAAHEKVAIGHFNVSDSTQFHGIVEAAHELGVPVVVGASDGERAFIGAHELIALVRVAQGQGMQVFANADHARTIEGATAAIDAGFDSVIFDGTQLSAAENIEKTREVVGYAKVSGRDLIIEGELGYIGSASKLLDDVPDAVLAAALPTPDDAVQFVAATGVSALAPAVGNIHGMLKGRKDPALRIDLIQGIKHAVNVPLVLHGASGNSDEDLRAAIAAGMSMVHINTEIRVAYRRGIEEALAADREEIAPYRYLGAGKEAMKRVVLDRLRLFNGR